MKSGYDTTFGRSNTNTTGSAIFNQDKRKVVANLQSMLKTEIEKREQAERLLIDYRRRSLTMEQQFKRLLQKYDNRIAVLNGHDNYGEQIWNKLVDEIERFNQDSQRMLEKRCGEIESMMTRRINEILEKMEGEIRKTKKLSQDEYSIVKQQIKEALKIAREIQAENEMIKKQNKELIFKVSMLKEEKNLLIEELNQKKCRLKKLMISVYEENQNMISSTITSRVRSKPKSSEYSPVPKFICEPSLKDINTDNPQFKKRISLSKEKEKKESLLKTDNHFKICLDREKRKNIELKSIVAKLHSKIKEANLLLQSSAEEKKKMTKQQTIKFYQGLIDNIRYKLYVTNGRDQPQPFSSVQLSKFLEN